MNKNRLISTEDLYEIEILTDVRISPSGDHVIYSQERVNPKNEKKYSNLWVVPTDGGNPFQFTFGDQKDNKPRWSPDGNTIAFLSNRQDQEKPSQIHLIPFHGGEARLLVEIEGNIESISWSPDGTKLLFKVRKTDQEVLDQMDGEKRDICLKNVGTSGV